jgi:hypothetical protein
MARSAGTATRVYGISGYLARPVPRMNIEASKQAGKVGNRCVIALQFLRC